MKKIKIIALQLFAAMFVLFLSSCNSNEPAPGNGTQKRSYCNITFTNTSDKYCAVIFLDGVPLNEIDDGWSWEGVWPLWARKSVNYTLGDTKFPKDLKIELHEISDETHYLKAIFKTFIKEGYYFDVEKDYKITIREDGCTINYTYSN